jgi:Tol biopolymer transport system component
VALVAALALPSAASTAPPTVSLTSPAAASILRGTVTVSADASADTASVEFKYFSEASPLGASIGTDTTAPYSVQFDTNAYPNTLIQDATIYAYATNADGTTESVGHSVTIDNAGGRIAFESNRDGNSEIWSMDTKGGNLQQLTFTNLGVTNTKPSIAPDGNTIAFERTVDNFDGGGDTQVFLMNADGTGERQLTTSAQGQNGGPEFSPDGSRIAFHTNRNGHFQIYVMNADGTNQTPVTPDVASINDQSPTWNPSGTEIAFDRSGGSFGSDPEIFRFNLNTGAFAQLTDNAVSDTYPKWSPDGQQILFVSNRSGTVSVWKMSAVDGSNAVDESGASIYDADETWSPDGSHIAFVRDSGGQAFNVWTARPELGFGTNPHAELQITNGGSPSRNSFPDWGPVQPPSSATVNITGTSSTKAGAQSVALSGIPLDAIRGATDQTSGAATPLGGIPLGGIPLGGIPLGGIPLGGIPLGGIGFTAANLSQNGLGGVPLSTIPLKLPDSWRNHLPTAYANTPLQNVTLAQIVGTSAVSGITLKDLDLSSSPLGGIPLGGIALGGIPLGGIPISGDSSKTSTQNLSDWCDYIHRQQGFATYNCSQLTSTTSMLDLGLQGVPLGGIPLGGIPLGGIPLGGIPLGGIGVGTSPNALPLGGIDLSGTPLGGIPLGGISMSTSPLGGIPLGGINFASSPLGGIPLGGIGTLTNVVLCTGSFTCPAGSTLADAYRANAIKPGATLADLVGAFTDANGNPIKIQDIGYFCVVGTPANASCRTGETPIKLQDLVRGLPGDTTLEDLLATILNRTSYDWEDLPLPGFPLQDFSTDGGNMTYTVTFTVQGSGAPATALVGVHLPDGARYVAHSVHSADVGVAEPTLQLPENELSFPVTGIPYGTAHSITFQARPGLELGTESTGAKIAVTGLPTVVDDTPANTQITETFTGDGEIQIPNDTPDRAFQIAPDTLYMGYTPNGARKSYFKLPTPPAGTEVTFHLSHLHVDDDMVVFGQPSQPLRSPHPAGSSQSVPDTPQSLNPLTAIAPEVQTDVPQAIAGQQVLGASDNRGFADEEVSVGTPESSNGFLTIQVSSYDGGFSDQPWMLRVEETPAIPLPTTCQQPTGPGTGTATTQFGDMSTPTTLYLVNAKRIGDLYGSTDETNVINGLHTLASRTDAAHGAVIPVENNAAVATAYGAWTSTASPQNYCSPAKANDVVRSIGSLLDAITAPTVKYIVLVGDDPVIPYGRILDNTSYANERGYATTFLGGANNEYLSTFGLGFLPSDDPYGASHYSGTGPYTPDISVGRLTETPSQIVSLINQYVQRNGAFTPTRSVVTGYDFLKDGAQAVANGALPAPVTLINDTWSKDNLTNALFPGTTGEIDSINAHFDHNRALPADENLAGRETNLFTTADISSRGASAVLARLGLTMGCHSGLAVSDKVVSAGLQPDWPQTWGSSGGAGWMGNTGFGLGDTAAVAYSERLNALFAQRLDGTMTVGQALMFSKQEYAAIPYLTDYDLKVIDESTLYGLPMYRLGTLTTPVAPVPPPTFTDPTTGLVATSFSVSPNFGLVTTPTGNYYTTGGSASFVNRRPIQPTTNLDITEPGLVAHGAVVTTATSTDETGFNVAFSRVVDDLSAATPPLAGDAVFPSKLQSVTSLNTPGGQRQRLLLYTGQFRSGSTDHPATGIQRRFGALSGTVLYAGPNNTDFTPPTFGPVSVTAAGSTVGFAVDVDDPNGATDVKRVFALYRDGTGTWKTAEFSNIGSRWSGGGTVVGTTVEWFIQAVDAAGNVGVTSNKATIESLVPPANTGNIAAHLSGTLVSGWYTTPVGVTIDGAPGISYSLDGGEFTTGTSLTVTGTGVHSLAFQGTDGSHGSVSIPIDVTNPTISFASPAGIFELGQNSSVTGFSCGDAGSGVASCIPGAIDTSTITPAGTVRHVTVTATDRVGRTTTATGDYRVVYAFRGFFQPITNRPYLNVMNAGRAVPVKFSLTGNRGLQIFASGYPQVSTISCDAEAPQDDNVQTTTAGQSSLSYDSAADQYTYLWSTDRAWAGTCKQLNLRLADGTDHIAYFRFPR